MMSRVKRACAAPRDSRVGQYSVAQMSTHRPLRVLFLCTGNSARSQIAEVLLRHLSKNRVEVVSAGAAPQREVHPRVKDALKALGISAPPLTPKSMGRF